MSHRLNTEELQLPDMRLDKETAVYVLHETQQKLVLSESIYSGS